MINEVKFEDLDGDFVVLWTMGGALYCEECYIDTNIPDEKIAFFCDGTPVEDDLTTWQDVRFFVA